jgi:PAS domain S-box-containing protein
MDSWLQAYRRSWTHETSEEALSFYARLFDEAPAAIIVTNRDFAIIDANIAAQNLLQRRLTVLKGKPFHQNIAPTDRTAFSVIARQIISEPGRVTRPLLLKTGDDRNVEVSLIACALRGEDGEAQSVMILMLERGETVTSDIL